MDSCPGARADGSVVPRLKMRIELGQADQIFEKDRLCPDLVGDSLPGRHLTVLARIRAADQDATLPVDLDSLVAAKPSCA